MINDLTLVGLCGNLVAQQQLRAMETLTGVAAFRTGSSAAVTCTYCDSTYPTQPAGACPACGGREFEGRSSL